MSRVRVSAHGVSRLRAGHPWVFRSDVVDVSGATHGGAVEIVASPRERFGYGFYSESSKIAVRRIDGAVAPPDRRFWEGQVESALAHRRRSLPEGDAWRVLFGESDGIPGLIADLYGGHLVVQALTAGAEKALPDVLDAISARIPVVSVLARHDVAVRALEGLPRGIHQLRGTTPDFVEIGEGPVTLRIDPRRGQKTGAFLDQRENRLAAAELCRGGRVLDAFCHQGAFALLAARAGCRVDAVDQSAEAVARGQDDSRRNGVAVEFRVGNAFDDLRARERSRERFDLIFLDPPAFAKSRAEIGDARRGYKDVNLRAMRLLVPGGILVTSSCSYNLREAEFGEVVAEAAADVRRVFRILEKRTQSRDHPIRLGFPESHYLKCLLMSVR